MKKLFMCMAFAPLFFSCTTAQTVESKVDTPNTPAPAIAPLDTVNSMTEPVALTGTWVLYAMDGSTSAWEKIPFLSLDVKTGAFNTGTRCKGMTGRFVAQGTSCVFDNEVITTKMGCNASENENRFLQLLLRVNNYSTTDSTLQLKTQNVATLTFKRQPI
jgi:heat shock protein HslJ